MRLEELGLLCTEAATNAVERHGLPVPAIVVLPLPDVTKVVTLEDFPADEAARVQFMERFVTESMRPDNAPGYGFVAGAVAGEGDEEVDVVMAVYGARSHHPKVTAAAISGDAVGEFAPPEDLVMDAMPFVAPLQQAADAAQPPDVMSTDPPGGPHT